MGNCGVTSIADSITTTSPNEIIVSLVSWDNTSAFQVNAGWNFRYSEYAAPGGSGNTADAENLTEYWQLASTAGTYTLQVTSAPNPETCVGVLEACLLGSEYNCAI